MDTYMILHTCAWKHSYSPHESIKYKTYAKFGLQRHLIYSLTEVIHKSKKSHKAYNDVPNTILKFCLWGITGKEQMADIIWGITFKI